MKDLGKTKFCLGLQIEHFPNEILVHQSTYAEKVLKHFYMEKAHPLSTPIRPVNEPTHSIARSIPARLSLTRARLDTVQARSLLLKLARLASDTYSARSIKLD